MYSYNFDIDFDVEKDKLVQWILKMAKSMDNEKYETSIGKLDNKEDLDNMEFNECEVVS